MKYYTWKILTEHSYYEIVAVDKEAAINDLREALADEPNIIQVGRR